MLAAKYNPIPFLSGGGGSGTPSPTIKDLYISKQFGALVCWNMPTWTGENIGDGTIPINTFSPTDLDVDQWLDAVQAAGCKYAFLTAKHHDGFALWPTAYHVTGHAPYSIASTDWYANNGSPDVLGLFMDGCRSRGITPGIYFSILDQTYEAQSGTTQETDAAGYVAMIKAQLTELLTQYGDVLALWFDGWGWSLGYTYITYADIMAHIKAINPNCVIVENYNFHPCATTEIDEYENGGIPGNSTLYAEEVVRIRTDGSAWFYETDETPTLRSSASIKTERARVNTIKANYLLGIYPDRTGHLPAAQVTRLGEIGA